MCGLSTSSVSIWSSSSPSAMGHAKEVSLHSILLCGIKIEECTLASEERTYNMKVMDEYRVCTIQVAENSSVVCAHSL